MMPATAFLLALKGTCALNCLAALHLAGPLPVTQRTVMDLTGFEDVAVSKGLAVLRALGLVTCTGDDRRTAWQLAAGAQRLPLPLDPIVPSLENLDSVALIKEEEKEKESSDSLISSSLILEAPSLENLDSVRPPRAPLSPARRRAERVLRGQFYAAFEAAGIFLQYRRVLADALLAAEDGPAGLRQTLGWLCYAERRLPHVKRGAVVYISLRDELPCDPAYLPPPDLRFEAALAWAMRGGEAEPAPLQPPQPFNDVDNDQTPGDSGSSPERDLWQALITRLARELSPVVIDSQLRPARLLSLEAQRCLIGAATPQSRDWLRTRLAAVLARALSELAGRPLAVEIVVDT